VGKQALGSAQTRQGPSPWTSISVSGFEGEQGVTTRTFMKASRVTPCSPSNFLNEWCPEAPPLAGAGRARRLLA